MDEQPDPMIKPGHVIHWKICKASYMPMKGRPANIDGWQFIGETWDTVFYYKDKKAILGYKGTEPSVKSDILNDIILTLKQNKCPPKTKESTSMLSKFFAQTKSTVPVQLTGHSLGGATARCVGNMLQLNVVTFNAAAPPTGIVQTEPSPRETNYHIFGDIISAWQCPNTIRIDKGHRPVTPGNSSYFELSKYSTNVAFVYSLIRFAGAHSLSAFALGNKAGVPASASQENAMFNYWYGYFPGWGVILTGAVQGTTDFFNAAYKGAEQQSITGQTIVPLGVAAGTVGSHIIGAAKLPQIY